MVDASVWVSRLVLADSHYAASRAWLAARTDAGEVLAMPSIVLPEVAGAVARRTGSGQLARRAASVLQKIPGVRLAPVDQEMTLLAVDLAASLRLRGADALYVALAQRLSVPLVTWDEEQRRRAGSAVQTVTPQEAA